MTYQNYKDLINELNDLKCISQINAFVKHAAECRTYKLLGTNFILDVVWDNGHLQMQWLKEQTQGFIRTPWSVVTIEELFEEVPEKIKLELVYHINIFNRSVGIEVE